MKLGVRRLTAAYKAAAKEALNNAIIVEWEPWQLVGLQFAYNAMPDVMRMVKEFDLKVMRKHFEVDGRMLLEVKGRFYESVIKKLELINALGKEVKLIKP